MSQIISANPGFWLVIDGKPRELVLAWRISEDLALTPVTAKGPAPDDEAWEIVVKQS